jgi:Astacin (Peptidase family M12A)
MFIILIVVLVLVVVVLTFFLQQQDTSYTCGVGIEPEYRAVGATTGFKPGQIVNIAFEGNDTNAIINALAILKEFAFPFINLKFQIGRTGDCITIRFNTNKTDKNVSGSTTGIGTKNPIITLYTFTQGVLLHEFGHALGMFHEFQNPAPNNPVVWDTDKVYALYIGKQGWKKENVQSQILNKKDKSKSLFTSWDPESIMNYNIMPGLTSAPVQIFKSQEYSFGDKEWFALRYN